MKEKGQEIAELLSELVRYQTTKENPKELDGIIDFVEKLFLDRRVTLHKYKRSGKPSLVITFSDTKKPKVLFVGHLDVVEAEKDQFEPRIEGNRFFARGALDMKGPDAVMIQTFLDIEEIGPPYPDIGLMLTTDEEVGSENGVNYLLKEEGWRAEFAIIPDGGENFSLIVEEKGAFHVLFKAKGKAAHGSRVWKGENAIDKLLKLYYDVTQDFPQEPCGDSEHWHNTLNLGKMVGGDAINRVPDYAEMGLDIRFISPWTVQKMKQYLEEKIKKFNLKDVEMEVLSVGEVVRTPQDHPLLIQYQKTASKILGRQVPFSKEHGATDGRFFAEKEIPVVITSPVGGNIHGRDEWVNLDSLETLYNIFQEFVKGI